MRAGKEGIMDLLENPESAPAPAEQEQGADRTSRVALAIAAAWVLTLGFDMFLHAGIFARLYVKPGPFLLEPEEAFRRIPLGYLAFLILTAALAWLIRRLGVRGATAGFRYGLAAGAIVWGALAVGLFSFSTMPLPLLSAWWIGQAIELGLAGAVLGAAAGGVRLKRIWLYVICCVVVFVAVTVFLQSAGMAPPMKIR
jgi:hypothetical protein